MTSPPIKIFLSYGHDLNTPVVERIRDDLTAAGYKVWFDKDKIETGDHWRRSILDGLNDSDWTLGFLSRHSVRDPGVCLDELSIAMGLHGGAVATILLETEQEVRAPVSVTHIQWLDMSDWTRHGAIGNPGWEDWYRPKLKAILDLLASPRAAQFAGEIATLEAILKPVSQAAEIERLIGGFLGRQWLLDRIESWRKGASGQRMFCVTGDPGAGKSAFAAWLAHHGRGQVIGVNLCDFYTEDRRDTRRILRTLAFQMATRLQDYRSLLLDRLRRLDPEGAELASKNPWDLFDWLIAEPLSALIDGGRSGDRVLLVIDALDETIRDGRSELAELLAHRAGKLPGWVRLLVTSRDEAPVSRQLAGAPQIAIIRNSAENRADLRRYAEAWLGGSDPALIDRILDAANGSFIYLRLLRQGVENRLFRLDATEVLPPGLIGLYERWFRRQFPDPAVYARDIRPALEVVAAASNPVPEKVLEATCCWVGIRDKARVLTALRGLFDGRPEGVTPFHKSIRDWLTDHKAAPPEFLADEKAGSARLFAALWADLAALAASASPNWPDSFLSRELPVQVARRADAELREAMAATDRDPIFAFIGNAAQWLEGDFSWDSALAWWGMLARLARAVSADNWRALASEKIGKVLVAQGDLQGAMQSFGDSLAIRNRLALADPSNVGWQRDLSVSYEKIGEVLVAQGDLQNALQSFRDSLAIRDRLALADPSIVSRQRDLSVSYEKIGEVLVAQGDLQDALQSFRGSLAIRDQLAQLDPRNAGRQRDLSVSSLLSG